MKRNLTTILVTLSLLFSLAGLRAFSSRAASGHTGVGQQVGEPSRIPAISAGGNHSLARKSDRTVIAWDAITIPQGQSLEPAPADA